MRINFCIFNFIPVGTLQNGDLLTGQNSGQKPECFIKDCQSIKGGNLIFNSLQMGRLKGLINEIAKIYQPQFNNRFKFFWPDQLFEMVYQVFDIFIYTLVISVCLFVCLCVRSELRYLLNDKPQIFILELGKTTGIFLEKVKFSRQSQVPKLAFYILSNINKQP